MPYETQYDEDGNPIGSTWVSEETPAYVGAEGTLGDQEGDFPFRGGNINYNPADPYANTYYDPSVAGPGNDISGPSMWYDPTTGINQLYDSGTGQTFGSFKAGQYSGGPSGTSTAGKFAKWLKDNLNMTPDQLARLAMAGVTLADLLKSRKDRKAAQVPSYKWNTPMLQANRTQIAQAPRAPGQGAVGQSHFTAPTYTARAAQGGIMALAKGGLRHGSFIIPADVVSHFGNGSSEAGLEVLSKRLGAVPIKGKGDGMSDSIDTTIEGQRPAKVAHEEAIVSPEKVAALGGGDPKKGANVLYSMMDRVRKARTGTTKQGKQINPAKFVPGGAVGYAGGGIARFIVGGNVSTDRMPAGGGSQGVTYTNQTGNTQTINGRSTRIASDPTSVQRAAQTEATNAAGQYNAGVTAANNAAVNTNLAAWAGPYVTDYLSKGFALADAPYEAYTGQISAGESELQKDAFQKFMDLDPYAGTTFSSGYSRPAAYTTGTFNSGFSYTPTSFNEAYYQGPEDYKATNFTTGLGKVGSVESYMNPYMQNVVDINAREARRQADIDRLGIASRLTAAGAYGGSRQAILEAEQRRNLQQQIGDIQAKGSREAYENALARQLAVSKASMEEQAAEEASRQFAYTGRMSKAELMARYGLDADKAQALENQFKAKTTADFKLAEQKLKEESRQYGYGQDMTAADRAAYYGLEAQKASESSKQFGAKYGLDALAAQLGAGSIQRGIEQDALTAAKTQFDEERKYPLEMQKYKQALLGGLPIGATPAPPLPTFGTEATQALVAAGKQYPQLKQWLQSMGITIPD